jgi:siderophore synthetase component
MPNSLAHSLTTAALPTADEAVAHTLLNCLLREVSGPEHETAVVNGYLLLRLPRRGVLLRVALRRTSLLGAHRFTGAVQEQGARGWTEVDWRRLADQVQQELTLRTGIRNDEFLNQLASSHDGVATALAARTCTASPLDRAPLARAPLDPYLESEQSLIFGHRFHPTPKARSADRDTWAAYAPETLAAFPLRHLAVRASLVAGETAVPGADTVLDRLRPVPDGYRLLPAHPWQYELLREHPLLRAAIARGDVLDLGTGGAPFIPTASVRTLYGKDAFLKFSLNVRITNCLRKNASYELAGAVVLTRLLAPVLDELTARFSGSAMLREPAYRSLAIPGPDGRPDISLLEGFGVIVRDRLERALRPGLTPLLAAAVADEYPTSSAHISHLLGPGSHDPQAALDWWAAYLRLLLPPVLAAYTRHGVVFEPHLQNVLIAVDDDGIPRQVIFRDLEGTKLLAERHTRTLAALPADVAAPIAYDAQRGWDRVVYCLLVNNAAEILAALADLHPHLEPTLWAEVRNVLREFGDEHGYAPGLRALLAGVPLPAKANLLTRWERRADREAHYVRLPSPLADDILTAWNAQ